MGMVPGSRRKNSRPPGIVHSKFPGILGPGQSWELGIKAQAGAVLGEKEQGAGKFKSILVYMKRTDNEIQALKR